MRPIPTSIVAAAAMAAVALTVLPGCGGNSRPTVASTPAATTPTSTADTRSAQQRAEDTFITATAVHLCTVQSTVYDDPKDMADAYHATPSYPGVPGAQIKQFQQRLTTDTTFANRLTSQLKQTCKPR